MSRITVSLVLKQPHRSAKPRGLHGLLGLVAMGNAMKKNHPSHRNRSGVLVFAATAHAAAGTPGFVLSRFEAGVTSPTQLQIAGAGA